MDDDEEGGFGTANWLKAIGGLLFFIAGQLPWWRLTFDNGIKSATEAWDYDFTGKLPYFIFVAMALLTVIIKTESLRLPHVLVDPLASLIAASVGTLAVAYRFIFDSVDDVPDLDSVSRGVGLYLAAVAALMVLAGCILDYREHRALDVDEAEDDDAYASLEDDTPEDNTPEDDTPVGRPEERFDRPSPPLP